MEFRVLGPLEVVDDRGRDVSVGHPRERALLCLLLVSVNRVTSAERLTCELWPDTMPDDALHALRVHVSRLRKALRAVGGEGLVLTRAPGYVLEVDVAAIDAHRFEARAAEGRRLAAAGSFEAAATTFRDALSLWRGPAFPELAGALLAGVEAARLEEARLVALEDRIDADLAAGRHHLLAAELETLTQAHPLREQLWGQRMLALYRAGRQADALRACGALRDILREELGIDPSPSVARLERDILNQAPELEAPTIPAPGRPSAPVASPTTPSDAGRSGALPPLPDAERKHVTVVCAEIDDFMSMSERLDADTVHEIVDGCFATVTREVERYGGTVTQFTGAGLIALFGAPVSQEDHATRAVHAAWAVHQALANQQATAPWHAHGAVRLRLGVSSGSVVVGTMAGPAMGFAATGGTVQAAHALQHAAPPGGTLVSETTHRAASTAFHWRPVTPVSPEGTSAPVSAYELVGVTRTLRRFEVTAQRGLTRFVGRDAELGQLLAAWERARAGSAQIVSVVGEAGLGKSRLVHEFKEQLARQATPVYEGLCVAYGEIRPYLPFLDVIRTMLAPDLTAPRRDAKRMVNAHLAELGVDADTALYVHLLLGHPVPEELFDRASPTVIRQRTINALTRVILAHAEVAPLALIIEDAHWIDTTSQEALGALVETMAAAPLLLVLVYRPEYLHAWSDRAYHTEISLDRLGQTGTAAMVRAILAKPISQRIALQPLPVEQSRAMIQDLLGTAVIPLALDELVATRTDGNPLFVEELTRSLLEGGELVRRGEAYVMSRPADQVEVPSSIQGVLVERFDRLTGELRSLLQIASVLGRVFSDAVLHMMVQGDDRVERQLLELEDLEFVYLARLSPEKEYSFKHVLTQQAVYDTLVRSRREAYHERAGQALEALYPERLEEHYERLAHHYSRSPNAEKALEYLDLASSKAMRTNAMIEAKAYFDDAMHLLDRLPDTPANRRRRISMLAHKFFIFWLLFELPEYLELAHKYEGHAEELDDPLVLGAFYCNMAYCYWIPGDWDAFFSTANRVLDIGERAGNPAGAGLGRASMLMLWYHVIVGSYEDMLAWQPRALAACQRDLDIVSYIWSHTGAAIGYVHQGRWRDAVAECHAAQRVGEDYGDEGAASRVSMVLAWTYGEQGEIDLAIEHAERAVHTALTPADRSYGEIFLAAAWCRAGEPERGVETLARLSALAEAVQFRMFQAMTLLHLGEAYWACGQVDEARKTLESLAELATRHQMRYWLGAAHRLLAEVAWEADPTPRGAKVAVEQFRLSIEMLDRIGAENQLAKAYSGYALLCRRHGQRAEADRHLARAVEIFDRLGTCAGPDLARVQLVQ